jgi:2-polyprenyl-3-methyl-5-hydroxy-6-metoxy-1,4-benzoquinol methylase
MPYQAPPADLIAFYADCGGTDFEYLAHHWPRFIDTKERLMSSLERTKGLQLLDIGAHWLHQSLLYAREGLAVTAVDFPITFDLPSVQRVAEENGIRLLPETNLAEARALESLAENSIDVVLFTEIIEHITFNPVQLWKQVYRVMKPGARVVVTTPNYYAARGRVWNLGRLLGGFGGGLDVPSILGMRTYAHHWKEYSLRELIHYFCALSPDFRTVRAAYVQGFSPVPQDFPRALVTWLERHVSRVKPNLYLEVELRTKSAGIAIEPSW